MSEHSFALKADLGELVGDQKIISATIGPFGEACLLLVPRKEEATALARDERPGFASFPRSIAENAYKATFILHDEGVVQRTELNAIEQAYPTAQPLPNGEILIVGHRCHFRNGDPEKNAAVYDRDGNLLRRFVLGDGIQDVQTTRDGLIWVSYFDEGVMGNFGWRKPIGAPGIVCFDASGDKVWQFEPPAGMDIMVDCYAMNVADSAVWACWYTEFPVARIDSQRCVRAWKNSVAGANAIAVDGWRVVLWGGYRDNASRCVIQEYSDREDELKNLRELSLRFPREIDWKQVRVIGRVAALHAFAGALWFI